MSFEFDPSDLHPDPLKFEGAILAEQQILAWFDRCDAFWMHDGDPKKPHAELSSGLCSNGFFDCLRVLEHPTLCEILADQLVWKFAKETGIYEVDWVIGSPYAAITFSHEIAKSLKARAGFAEKDPEDPKGKKMVWRRRTIPKGATVLQAEELITTSGTFRAVRQAIVDGNSEPVNFAPIIAALVHRPPKLPADYGDVRVISLIEREVWAVQPAECPLCKAGSKRVRPKTHWAELTGKA